jgi:hypothetical protein
MGQVENSSHIHQIKLAILDWLHIIPLGSETHILPELFCQIDHILMVIHKSTAQILMHPVANPHRVCHTTMSHAIREITSLQ